MHLAFKEEVKEGEERSDLALVSGVLCCAGPDFLETGKAEAKAV